MMIMIDDLLHKVHVSNNLDASLTNNDLMMKNKKEWLNIISLLRVMA